MDKFNKSNIFCQVIFTNLQTLNDPKYLINLSYKVKCPRNALLHISKRWHKTGKLPVLVKPTHMMSARKGWGVLQHPKIPHSTRYYEAMGKIWLVIPKHQGSILNINNDHHKFKHTYFNVGKKCINSNYFLKMVVGILTTFYDHNIFEFAVVSVYIEGRPLVFWDYMFYFTYRFIISGSMGVFLDFDIL